MAVTRRDFFRYSSVAAGSALIPQVAGAIEPVQRLQEPKFKFSLAAYSYRSLLGGKDPQLTLQDFIDDCARMNLEGTELTSYYFPKAPTPEFLRGLKGHAFKQGLTISGTAVGNDLCHPPGEKRDQQLAYVKEWVDYAEIMGAPVIRIFSGNTKSGQSPEEAHRLAVEGMEECCQYAGEHGVFLALENHGGLTSEVDGMLQLIKDVKSPWFGVNVDTGNFHSSDVYGDLAKIAPYALNVQVKVVIKPAGGEKQPTDFPRLAQILKDTDYRGFVVLEFEEKEDPRKACPEFVEVMREAFTSA